MTNEQREVTVNAPTMDEWRHAADRLVHLRDLITTGTNLPDSVFMVAAPPDWCPLGGSSVIGMEVQPMLGITKPHLVVITP